MSSPFLAELSSLQDLISPLMLHLDRWIHRRTWDLHFGGNGQIVCKRSGLEMRSNPQVDNLWILCASMENMSSPFFSRIQFQFFILGVSSIKWTLLFIYCGQTHFHPTISAAQLDGLSPIYRVHLNFSTLNGWDCLMSKCFIINSICIYGAHQMFGLKSRPVNNAQFQLSIRLSLF